MQLLDLDRLGAHERQPKQLEFGVLLPGITSDAGYKVTLKIIHSSDQFMQAVQPTEVVMSQTMAVVNGYDYWSAKLSLNQASSMGGHFGDEGTYVYRFCVTTPKGVAVDNIPDPFARESSVGSMSAITVGYKGPSNDVDYAWSNAEIGWTIPDVRDLVVYEMMLAEFAFDIDGAIDRLPYIADLGVNCIEVMPVSKVRNTIDWGYSPIGYFCVDERFGKRRDFQRFVDAAHQLQIAVVIDAVFGHTDESFTYAGPYAQIGVSSPYNGPTGAYGRTIDVSKPFARDFIYTASMYWLDRYHVDGLRYDAVQEYRDGPTGQGFDNLAYNVFQSVNNLSRAGSTSRWRKFKADEGDLRLLQIAEYLDDVDRSSPDILETSYANSTWQDRTLWAARRAATDTPGALDALGNALGAEGFPEVVTLNNDTIVRSPLQYLENHDHERLICSFKRISYGNDLLTEGDRSLWYKLQPYLIGLMTAKGTPFLWQGEEFGENYDVPAEGWGRVRMLRPVAWDYFYDEDGRGLVRLTRKLTRIRRDGEQFRRGKHFFQNFPAKYQDNGLLLFARWTDTRYSLVALNFTDGPVTTDFAFPVSGDFSEELEGNSPLRNVVAGAPTSITVPSNYGCIWTHVA